MKVQSEPLLKLQTKEYIEFIRSFTESVSIMTKNFFVVVPYTHVSLKPKSGIFSSLFSRKIKEEEDIKNQLDFEEKEVLTRRKGQRDSARTFPLWYKVSPIGNGGSGGSIL